MCNMMFLTQRLPLPGIQATPAAGQFAYQFIGYGSRQAAQEIHKKIASFVTGHS